MRVALAFVETSIPFFVKSLDIVQGMAGRPCERLVIEFATPIGEECTVCILSGV